MGDRVGLVTNEVVEAVGGVGVDKAVADPLTGTDRLVDVRDDLKCRFNAVFFDLADVQCGDVIFPGEAKDVKGFVAGQGDKLAAL